VKDIILRLILRWAINTFGLWVASELITSVDYGGQVGVLLIASLILSIVNALIKPLLVLLSLPFIALTLGLFTVLINGALVWLVSVIYVPFEVGGFTYAVLAGIVVGLVNYMLTILLDRES
jgi:putative membrane protein